MRVKYVTGAVFILLMAMFWSEAVGQHAQMMKKEHEGMGLPNLSEEQKEKMKEIMTETEKQMLPIRSKLQTKEAELNELLIVEKPDRSAIDRKIDEIAALKTEIRKKCVDTRLKIRELLTPEQRVKFDQRPWMDHKCFGHRGMGPMKKRMHLREFKRGEKAMDRDKEKVEVKE